MTMTGLNHNLRLASRILITHIGQPKILLVIGQVRHKSYHATIHKFLANQEGADEFVGHLGGRERQVLYQALLKSEQGSKKTVTSHGGGGGGGEGAGKTDKDKARMDSDAADVAAAELVPTWWQLRKTFFHEALPFIGFGFLDNLIMIVAGDYIDTTLGVTLGISTMAAAGLGNALSDVAGIGSASWVEWMAVRVGVPLPGLSPVQMEMKRTRWTIHAGRAIGVFVGCLLGMFPLLFRKRDETKESENTPNKSSGPKAEVAKKSST